MIVKVEAMTSFAVAQQDSNADTSILGESKKAGVENIFLFLGPQSEIEKFSVAIQEILAKNFQHQWNKIHKMAQEESGYPLVCKIIIIEHSYN